MLNGRMDQMNNAIMGRSAFSVIAMEAQKASQQRDKANGLLAEIADHLLPKGQLLDPNPSTIGSFAS